MAAFVNSTILLLVLLNPFALSVYLLDILRNHTMRICAAILLRASLISGIVFALFAWTGDRLFTDVLQVRFAAFQIFGGILFLLIALRYMLSGGQALVVLRGEPEHLAGSIAMPFMIGPGTVSAATLTGLRLGPITGLICVITALLITLLVLLALKFVFDRLRDQNARLLQRYTDIASRITALVVGTVAVQMVFQGIEAWLKTQPWS